MSERLEAVIGRQMLQIEDLQRERDQFERYARKARGQVRLAVRENGSIDLFADGLEHGFPVGDLDRALAEVRAKLVARGAK